MVLVNQIQTVIYVVISLRTASHNTVLDGGNGAGSPVQQDGSGRITQSYRRLTLDQALARL